MLCWGFIPFLPEALHFFQKEIHNISSRLSGDGVQNQPIFFKKFMLSPMVTTRVSESAESVDMAGWRLDVPGFPRSAYNR